MIWQPTLNEKSNQLEEVIRSGFTEVFENICSNIHGSGFHSPSNEVKYNQNIVNLQTEVTQYSFLDKEYFLFKEMKTLDEADSICKHRNQRLVQINSQQVNDFIYNHIVKPASNQWNWQETIQMVRWKRADLFKPASELPESTHYSTQRYFNETSRRSMVEWDIKRP